MQHGKSSIIIGGHRISDKNHRSWFKRSVISEIVYHQTSHDNAKLIRESRLDLKRAGDHTSASRYDHGMPHGLFFKPTDALIRVGYGPHDAEQLPYMLSIQNPFRCKSRKDIAEYLEFFPKYVKLREETMQRLAPIDLGIRHLLEQASFVSRNTTMREVRDHYRLHAEISEFEKLRASFVIQIRKFAKNLFIKDDFDGIIIERDDDGRDANGLLHSTPAILAFKKFQARLVETF